MSNIEKFDITCKFCGGKNVELSGHSGESYSVGYLNCSDCGEEEEHSN